jgi:iduronate 2-sulfatase
VMGYAVKTSHFNYVEWINLSTGEVLAKELYDHSIDPKETKNIIGNDTYAETVKLLASKVKERKDATDHDHASKF